MAAGLLLAGGVTVAAILLTGGDDSTADASPRPSATTATASLVAPELLAGYQPQQVTRSVSEGRIQVSWQAPARTEGIVGYMAIAQSPAGIYQKTEMPGTGETSVVFAGAPVTADSCVVVVTLISGAPAMKLAPGVPACAPRATGTSTPVASGSSTPPPTPPR